MPRKYAISQAVIEQRRKAAQLSAQKRKGRKYLNGYRHGLWMDAKDRIKPCISACVKFPCKVVEEGHTKPGGDCLEKSFEIRTYLAIRDAIKNGNTQDYDEIHCFLVAEVLGIVRDLIEKIRLRGVFIGKGKDMKLNPALLPLPKLIADLGLTPSEMLLTRQSKVRAEVDEQTSESLAVFLSRIGSRISRKEPISQIITVTNNQSLESLENQGSIGDGNAT